MQKSQFMFILGLLFSAIVAVFALTNNNTVAINFIFYKVEGVSQAVVIFVSAALGAIIVTMLGLVKHLLLKNEVRKLKKENKDLITKVESLTEQLAEVAEARNKAREELANMNANASTNVNASANVNDSTEENKVL